MGLLSVYNLGSKGVNVDKSSIHLEDGELTQAQNATNNDVDGALNNRPGLVKHNSVAADGNLLGGIAVPLSGSTTSGSVDTAIMFRGFNEEWYKTSNLWVSEAVTVALAAWQGLADVDADLPNAFSGGAQRAVVHNGKLYYPGSDYTIGTTSPPIRVFNGVDDYELCKILPATTRGIVSMISDHGKMYVLTLDSGTSDSDFVGRVFELSPSGSLTQIGTAVATGHVPGTVAVHNGLLFLGTVRQTATNSARIYRINPADETTWTLEETLAASVPAVRAFASFQGLLYAATTAAVRQRSLAGSWTEVDAPGGLYDLKVFGGFLYSVYTGIEFNFVRRTSNGTTWAAAATLATGANTVSQFRIFGLRLFVHSTSDVNHTLNGTAWTNTSYSNNASEITPFGTLAR